MDARPLVLLVPMLLIGACSQSKNGNAHALASHEKVTAPSGTQPADQATGQPEADVPQEAVVPPLETAPSADKPSRLNADAPSKPVDLSTVEIRLERTECYGWCPNYSIVISGNGHVQYIGRTFVREVGDREATVPQDTVRDLLGQFEKVKFVDLQDAYTESVTDCQATFLTLRLDDRSKRVRNYWAQGAFDDEGIEVPDRKIHEQLDGLADAIDKAVSIEQWIGSEGERRALRDKFPEGWPGRMESK